jgi:polyhydroxyalkanoate synthase subunit PhaC
MPIKKKEDKSLCDNKQSCVAYGASKYVSQKPDTDQNVSEIDRYLHSVLSNIYGTSPGSLSTSYFDWLFHLALSPGRMTDLTINAWEKTALFANYAIGNNCGRGKMECCAQPLPQDRRFIGEEWEKWPFNLYQQFFLLAEDWWQEATGSVRGVSQHHKDVVTFLTRQWLDMFSPLNFPITNPHIIKTTFEQKGTNFIEGLKNYSEDLRHLITGEPPVGANNYIVGNNIACTKGKVIYRNKLIELIQYEPETKEVYAEPILIVPAWIMKYYILDLSPKNSLVKYLVEKGHTVFMISWKNPDATYRNVSFEDYLNLGIMDAINQVSEIFPNQKIHATGYCLGGTLLSIAAAYMAKIGNDLLKSVTLFAAQVDFEEAGELLLFIDESQISYLEDSMWQKGFLDSKRMSGTFYMLRSHDLIWSRIVENYMLGKRSSLNDLMAWNADATRMPYRMHSEYLRKLFLNNDLSEARFKINGKTILLSDIRSFIFAVSTQRDHVAPWKSVYKINLFTNTEITFLLTSGGHNAGIISEPDHPRSSYQVSTINNTDRYISPDIWQQKTPSQQGSWWPVWQQWLVNHSSGKIKAPTINKAICDAPGNYVMEK